MPWVRLPDPFLLLLTSFTLSQCLAVERARESERHRQYRCILCCSLLPLLFLPHIPPTQVISMVTGYLPAHDSPLSASTLTHPILHDYPLHAPSPTIRCRDLCHFLVWFLKKRMQLAPPQYGAHFGNHFATEHAEKREFQSAYIDIDSEGLCTSLPLLYWILPWPYIYFAPFIA